MKNTPESDHKADQEPEHLLRVEDEDVEQLMKSFEEKQRAHVIGEQIAETSAELSKEQEERLRVDATSVVQVENAAAAKAAVDKGLEDALTLMDGDPAVAAMILLKPVTERLQAKLDPEGGFDRPHRDPRVQEAYDKMAQQLKQDAIAAVLNILEERTKSLAEGAPEKASIERLIAVIEGEAQGKSAAQEEEIKPLAEELEPERPAQPKKGFWQKLLGRK